MSLAATLDVDAGPDGVTFELTVRNDGDDDVDLTFSDAQRVEVTVRDGEEAVWRFGDGQMFAQMLGTETVSAGGTRAYAVEWDGPTPGEYEAEATLAAGGVDASATATFSV